MPFAVPTITGEIRRYFRDATWDVRVPRRIQELAHSLRACADDAAQELGDQPSRRRSPFERGWRPPNSRAPARGPPATAANPDEPSPAASRLTQGGDAFQTIDELESLLPAIRNLGSRDAHILYQR